jgi:DNA topoisomerase-1
MAPALLDQTTVDIGAGSGTEGRTAPRPYTFRASGSVIKFPGFLAVYREGLDVGDAPDDLDKGALPPLDKDEPLDLIKLWPEQHFTQPPPRFTEATLVKALGEGGIGRPSTYAPILSTIEQRGYVEKADKKFVPTDLGRVVNDLLVEQFPDVVDLNFTSQMENELDEVADGDRPWRALLTAFYNPFAQEIERAEREVAHISLAKPEPEKLGEPCPECGRDLLIRVGRFGKFIACSGFPTCRYTRPILTTVGVPCPVCGEGEMVEKRSRKGKVFFSCSRYPACTFSVWNRPVPGACPQCGGLIMVGNRNQGVKCSQCDWAAAEAPPDTGAIPHNNQPVQPADDATSAQPRTRRAASAAGTDGTGTKARTTTRKTTGTTTTRKAAASSTTKKTSTAKKTTTTTKKPAATTKKTTSTPRRPATNGTPDSLEDLFDMEPTGTETPRRR